MIGPIQKIHRKVLEIRESNDRTKKSWFVGASAITMTIVVLLWVVYLGTSLPSLTGQGELSYQDESASNSGFLTAITSKSAGVFHGVRRGFLEIIEGLKAPREMEIRIP